jgi:hypothetical protein
MTYALAMRDLHLRSETMRADEALADGGSRPHRSSTRAAYVGCVSDGGSSSVDAGDTARVNALVTTHNKRQNATGNRDSTSTKSSTNAVRGTVCLVAGCTDLCALPMCRLHFASLVCGKVPHLTLRSNFGQVKYDKDTQKAVYPSTVPADLLQVRKKGGSGPSRA